MSELADHIAQLLTAIFPTFFTVKREHYINYKGQKLFFDFYIKDLWLLIEIQGRQHSEFVEHFHGDREGFIKSKARDNLKVEYCQKNDLELLTINYDEKVETTDQLLEKINKAMSN